MTTIDLTAAIDQAIGQAMEADERIVILGEDVPALRRTLLAKFGSSRVIGAPISESAFLGAGVGAALAGLRPIVDILFIDFLSVGLHQVANEAAMIGPFSNGRWQVPMVIRAACGGGYGDAGQHQQTLWGMVAGIPGLTVVAPSTPDDAAGLMLTLLEHDGPSILLEHKLLSATWREELAGVHRANISLDLPKGDWPQPTSPEPVPLGKALVRRTGGDVVILTAAAGVHLSLDAAETLESQGVEVGVVDLRSISPLDTETIARLASASGAVLVVDEDYGPFGLSGEVAAVLAEAGIHRPFDRVTTTGVIPYARHLERQVLPSVDRILNSIVRLLA